MGAKQSKEMRDALELIRKGVNAAEASRRTGISKSAISQNAEYRKLREEVKRNAEKTA